MRHYYIFIIRIVNHHIRHNRLQQLQPRLSDIKKLQPQPRLGENSTAAHTIATQVMKILPLD